jgi:hypothetical protein
LTWGWAEVLHAIQILEVVLIRILLSVPICVSLVVITGSILLANGICDVIDRGEWDCREERPKFTEKIYTSADKDHATTTMLILFPEPHFWTNFLTSVLGFYLATRGLLPRPCASRTRLFRLINARNTLGEINDKDKEVIKEQPTSRNLSATATRVPQCTCPVAASRIYSSAIHTAHLTSPHNPHT